jgi:sulfur-carrier protein adenylyltransferase/sulfurtransferase
MLTPGERERYHRHLLLPELGSAGQQKLRAARVLVVGAGGLGSPAALYLAAAGIGTLGLVDDDRIELSNLQRQVLFTTAEVGAGKAETAAARLRALNPGIDVVAHPVRLEAGNVLGLIAGYDLVVDGSDRLATRYLVNDSCLISKKLLVSAAIHRFEGQALSVRPGSGPCYRCLFPESNQAVAPSCAEAGVLGVLPGILGSVQAAEAVKLLTGIGEPLVGRLLTFDALAMRWQEFRFARRADCAACGDAPTITNPAASAASVLDNSSSRVERLDPYSLQARLKSAAIGHGTVTLVDVREPAEFQAGHLVGSVNIPLAELPRRLAGLPLQFPAVFVCRSGARSLRAGALAVDAGHPQVAHLEGGLLAWGQALDPAMVVALRN